MSAAARLSALTTGRLLVLYQLIRQVSSALGLASINGPAALVRPLIHPMAEGAAERRFGTALPEAMRERIKGFAASADTVGQFFGEDIFVAIGSILLITGFVDTAYGLKLDALSVALWAIPTAICAYVIHGTRLFLLDRRLARMAAAAGLTDKSGDTEKDIAEAHK